MKTGRILIACERSGRVRDAFLRRGMDAISCDLEETDVAGPHIVGDALTVARSGDWLAVIGFPPCTHLCSSGARWWSGRQREQAEAIEFVLALSETASCTAIENPIGRLSTVWRKPDQILQPWQFGHGETKATCLWLRNLPVLEPTEIVDGREPAIWHMGPGPDRSRRRSLTYAGVAEAMAEQWTPWLRGEREKTQYALFT